MSGAVLEMRGVRVDFAVPGGTVQAVRGIDLDVAEGEIVGLVGETGSGKTTVGKAVIRLVEPSAGTITLGGTDVTHLSRRALRPLRRDAQMVFQDPYSSLNPRMTVARAVEHPLAIHGIGTRADRREKVRDAVRRVGLSLEVLDRFPGQLSGGQRQRVGLARTLVLAPRLLVADEPVSALDVSVQAGILNLLVDLQADLGFSCLFITHDLAVAEHLCDRVAVMYLGEVVEIGGRHDVLADGLHPYTRSLLDAVPLPDPPLQRARIRQPLPGDPPDPLDPPSGCPLHPRCPLADRRCSVEAPRLLPVGGDPEAGHWVRCHRLEESGIAAPAGGLPESEVAR